jgi:EmrB/QacA subfamily drug resistance transporter
MHRRTWALVAVVLGSGIVFLDSTVVNVALKAIGADLPASFLGVLEGQAYVVNGYLLTLSALLVLAGALADRVGRRRMFLIGLIGFGASSVLCGAAPTLELLVAFRLIQGIFGAILVPTSLAIITATFSGEERGRAFGIWAAASGATTIAGPLVGGFLVDALTWRLCFLLSIPLVIGAVAAAWRNLDESRDEEAGRRLDWLGAAVVAVGVGGLTFGAIRGQQSDWRDASAFVALGIGALATAAVVPLMALRRDPLVPLGLFRSRNFSVTNVSTVLIYGALYVYAYVQAIYLQGSLGYSALAAGIATVPSSLLLVFVSTQVGTLAARVGPRIFMTVGPALMAAGLLWLARIPATSAPWDAALGHPASLLPPVSFWVDVVPGVVVFGAGLAILVAPLTTALMTSVPARNSGLASAINNALSRIGPLLAGAAIFVALTATYYGSLHAAQPQLDTTAPAVREQFTAFKAPADVPTPQQQAARDSSTDAFHVAMLISAGLCLAGAAVNGWGIRNAPATG